MILLINLILAFVILSLLWMGQLRGFSLFLGALFVGVMFFFLIKDFKNDMKVNYQFTQSQCRILYKSVKTKQYSYVQLNYPDFLVRYSVDEQLTAHAATININNYGFISAEAAKDVINSYDVGLNYPCWYDPKEPSNVVLQQGWPTIIDNLIVTSIGILVFLIMMIRM